MSCIDRSNPFDPINVAPARQKEIQQTKKPALDSLVAEAFKIGQSTATYFIQFGKDSLLDFQIAELNQSNRDRNLAIKFHNDSIEAANLKQVNLDSLAYKSGLRDLELLQPFGPYAEFASQRAQLEVLELKANGIMISTNSQNAPLEVFPLSYRDSVATYFKKLTGSYVRLHAKIDSANSAVSDSNKAILSYNILEDSTNRVIQAYNDLILFRKTVKDIPLVVSADSIQTKMGIAKAGNKLFLGAGTFLVDLRFAFSGTVDSPIVIKGYPGMKTILKASFGRGGLNGSTLIVSSRSNIHFEGIVFRGGGISGVKLEGGCKNISFQHCQFDSSGLWGLEAIDSDIEMQDCLIFENGGGISIRGGISKGYQAKLINDLIVHNSGLGLEAVSPILNIQNCTFSDNLGGGLRFNSPLLPISISKTIVTGNAGIGLYREPVSSNPNGITIKECDIWRNTPADWDFAQVELTLLESIKKGNISINPSFQNPGQLNYGIQTGSELAGYEKQTLPIVIGYRP